MVFFLDRSLRMLTVVVRYNMTEGPSMTEPPLTHVIYTGKFGGDRGRIQWRVLLKGRSEVKLALKRSPVILDQTLEASSHHFSVRGYTLV